MDNQLIGKKIIKIREMTRREADAEGWDLSHNGCRELELDNGIKLYASCDYEGNNPGALFCRKGDKCFTVFPREDK